MPKNKKHSLVFAWFICGLGALYYAYEYLLRILPSVMEDPLRDHFHLTATGFGLLASMYYYAYVPMQLPVGIMMDRFGPRRLLTFACSACVIGSYLFANTTLFSVAASGRFIVGFGSAFAYVGVLKLATIWLPENKLAVATGSAASLGAVGAMVGDNYLGKLVHSQSWTSAIELSIWFGVILTITLWLFLRDHKNDNKVGGSIPSIRKNFQDLAIILRSKQIWINGMYGSLVYLPTTVFAELWGIPYLRHAHGLSHTAADFCNSLVFLGFTIGAPIMGYVSDKLKKRKPPMLIGALGAAFFMALVIYIPGLSKYTIGILLFLTGLFYSAQAIVFAVGRELSPKEAAGTAIATTNMFVMIGAMFLQPLIGRLLDTSHRWYYSGTEGIINATSDTLNTVLYSPQDYQFALSIIPVGIALAALLVLFLKETHARQLHN